MNDYILALAGFFNELDQENLLRAEALFVHLDYHRHELPLDNAMALVEFENDDKAQLLYRTYYSSARDILAEFGVVIQTEDTPPQLGFMLDMLETLIALERPEHNELIMSVLSTDDEAAMIFAELAEEFTEHSRMDIFAQLAEVEPALINLLRNRSNDAEQVAISLGNTAEILARLRAWVQLDESPLRPFLITVNTLPVGLDLAMDKTRDAIVAATGNTAKVQAIVGLAIMAEVPDEEMEARCLALRYEIFDGQAAQLDRLITAYVEEVLANG